MFDLTGQAALVTGGSRGLGREMATALALHGADVVLCSRKGAEAESAAGEIAAETGRRVVGLQADVTRRCDVEDLVEAAVSRLGRLDILVNNAGAGMRKPI